MTRFAIFTALFLAACDPSVSSTVDPTSVERPVGETTQVTIYLRTFDSMGNEIPCTSEFRMFFRTRPGAFQAEKGEAALFGCNENMLPERARIGQTTYKFDLVAWMPIEVVIADADGKMLGVPHIIQVTEGERGGSAIRFVSAIVK